MLNNSARIISLVPSWTETLLWSDINVVGRTRFCIHPADKISSIVSVGGTKNFNIEKILSLKPDFILLDKEENTLEMAETLKQHKIELLISHVSGFESVIEFLDKLSFTLSSIKLKDLAVRYENIFQQKRISHIQFLQKINLSSNLELESQNNFEYVIWKNPFMVVGQNTFISENFKLIDIELKHKEKYLQISAEELQNSFCFFSSEPYPFEKEMSELCRLGFNGILVDGEKVSWYGIRNLTFLESCVLSVT